MEINPLRKRNKIISYFEWASCLRSSSTYFPNNSFDRFGIQMCVYENSMCIIQKELEDMITRFSYYSCMPGITSVSLSEVLGWQMIFSSGTSP